MDPSHSTPKTVENQKVHSLEVELKARLRQQAAIAELGQFALTSSLQELLERTSDLLVEILNVDACKILELLPGGEELLLRAGTGWKPGLVGKLHLSAGKESQAGFTLINQGPVIVSDLREEKRFLPPSMLNEHGVISGMGVIIQGKERPFGVLSVHTKQPREFTADDIHFLESAAGLLASAVERQRVEEELLSSRNQLSVILESVADGITVQDRQGRLIYANETAAWLTGFQSAEELLNQPATEITARFEILNEDGQPFPLEELPGRQVLNGAAEASATLRFRQPPSGAERWTLVKARPVYDASGKVELAVNVFHDISGMKRSEVVQRLMARAGEALTSSLDVSATLNTVAQMCVPLLADWCTVHILEEGEVRQVAIAHTDPDKVQLAERISQRYPMDPDTSRGIQKVLRTGQAEFYAEISPETLAASAEDQEHLDLLRQLGPRSVIIVPLIARGRTLGSITLAWAESGRQYSEEDVELAQELARRAALAIDNARLFEESQQLNAELEKRVLERTNQLQATINALRSEVNERLRAEQALRESEQLLANLFESAPDGMILISEEGEILQVNAQVESIFNYRREELFKKSIETLLPEELSELHIEHRAQFMKEGRTRTMGAGLELFGRRKGGERFPIDIMLSPFETPEGKLVICAVRDVTERKKIEAELTEVQRRLIERVEAERLHLSQELHDGPIQELYGLTYQLKWMEDGSVKDPSLLEELHSAEDSIEHVINTLRGICNELRPPALADFGLDRAIEGHLDKIRQQQPDLKVSAHLESCQDALSERQQLALFRIYQTAVSNVLRHSGATRLEVRLACEDQQTLLEINDNGCGFEVPERWIELARRGHLGLVGTAERVQAIGGKLKIISAPSKGTTIRVTVPKLVKTQELA